LKAVFVELPAFERRRAEYLDDAGFSRLQAAQMKSPTAGELIRGTGGIRKLRFDDSRRGKGKRGGLRIIYYWWEGGTQFWLFTVYDKDEATDLTEEQRRMFKAMVKTELKARKTA
jgi:hypothetical protein